MRASGRARGRRCCCAGGGCGGLGGSKAGNGQDEGGGVLHGDSCWGVIIDYYFVCKCSLNATSPSLLYTANAMCDGLMSTSVKERGKQGVYEQHGKDHQQQREQEGKRYTKRRVYRGKYRTHILAPPNRAVARSTSGEGQLSQTTLQEWASGMRCDWRSVLLRACR